MPDFEVRSSAFADGNLFYVILFDVSLFDKRSFLLTLPYANAVEARLMGCTCTVAEHL